MFAVSDFWRSFLFLWGPWIVLLAIGSLLAFGIGLVVRRVLRARGGAHAAKWLIASLCCGIVAFVDVIALSFAMGRDEVSAVAAIALGMLLFVALIGLLGFGGYAVWRLVEQKPAS